MNFSLFVIFGAFALGNCRICLKITMYVYHISIVDDVIQLSSSNLNCAFSNPFGNKTYSLLNCALMWPISPERIVDPSVGNSCLFNSKQPINQIATKSSVF